MTQYNSMLRLANMMESRGKGSVGKEIMREWDCGERDDGKGL